MSLEPRLLTLNKMLFLINEMYQCATQTTVNEGKFTDTAAINSITNGMDAFKIKHICSMCQAFSQHRLSAFY